AADGAGLVVSLPYAREAARLVAERAGAALVEADLPLGLSGTERFLRAVAGASGRGARAERLIAAESAAAVRDSSELVMRVLSGRAALVRQDDPHLDAALRELCAEFGLLDPAAGDARRGRPLCFAPTLNDDPRETALVPTGYPNYLEHPVADRPFLGYAGFRQLADRAAAAALRADDEENAR
ncbi:MAG: hypothetical protein HY079_13035, partial [Elusimicrobia bacterium]|nr:hypothetical protein [Elusimicrobiota bacterium]